MEPYASYLDWTISSPDITMSANKSTAYRTGTTVSGAVTSLSTLSGNKNIYIEITVGPMAGTITVGLANSRVNISARVGADANGLGWGSDATVYCNAVNLGNTSFNYVAGNVIAIAFYGGLQLVKFRNVTQNTAWSNAYSLVSVGKPPYLLGISFDTKGDTAYANFYGPFTGAIPTEMLEDGEISPAQSPLPAVAAPAFTAWNPEALYSEQATKVIDFNSVLTDGSYTSANINDREPIPFSYVKWGDAVLDAQNNLSFTDVVVDDNPIFSIVLQVAGPANNWLWAAWDYGTPFVFDKVHIPTSASVAVSNIQIPPPPAPTTAPFTSQGHVLQIFSSCDVASVFTWSQGRVYGTEDVLVSGPVEAATYPPSAIGRAYTVTGGTVNATFPAYTPLFPPPLVGQGGGAAPTFPPPTPPPIGSIPAGVLVGPAIGAAGVPPSNAGIPLIRFSYGSATTPPASAAFPEFTTTFPSPPIVFSNIFTDGVSPTTPPSTASTICVTLSNNWGPPIGPALPAVVPPRQFMVAANGVPEDVVYAEPPPEPNGEVYDDSDEENAGWVEETPHRAPETPKPRRGRRRR